jgi:guanylate cyclase
VIPGSYGVVTALVLAVYARTGLFDLLRTSQLGLLLILPGLLQLSLGGFAPSGGMVIHSLLCPLTALLYLGPRAAGGWLFAWVAAMFMTARFEPAGLMPVSRLLMSLNLGGFGILVFLLVRHAVRVRATELCANKSTF